MRLIGGQGGTEVRYIRKERDDEGPPNAVSSIHHLPRGGHESHADLVLVILSYGYSSYK